MDLKQIKSDCQGKMDRTIEHLERELRGIRTGRATTALVEFVKVDYYGSMTELRDLAGISIPEATQILIKPFDPSSLAAIVKAIETADLGLNPIKEASTVRINVPPPSSERRKQLVGQVRKLAEDTRVAIRNERRDAIRHIDGLVKSKAAGVSEDLAKNAKEEIEDLTKKHTERVDEIVNRRIADIEAT
jgi:ribosome recycling factor